MFVDAVHCRAYQGPAESEHHVANTRPSSIL